MDKSNSKFPLKSINKRINDFILHLFIRNGENVQSYEVKAKYGYLEGWLSIFLNFILFIFKFIFGLLINSISLIADSFHTLSDVFTSIIVIVGFKIAKKPADEFHPYGHGRFETIATLVIAILIILIGIDFFKNSIERIIKVQVVKGSFLVVGILLFSSLLKEWLARFSIDLGLRIDSSALLADAWHHRSDAIASLLVTLAIIGALFGYHLIDPIFGLLVSGLLIYTGLGFGRMAVDFLIGRGASDEFVSEIEAIARSVKGVKGVHKIFLHDYKDQKVVSLHVLVDGRLNVHQSHCVATMVKNKIYQKIENISAEVHIEPSIEEKDTQR